MTEPAAPELRLIHEHGRALDVHYGDIALLRYVYRPTDAQVESPRPYLHPLRTLGGDPVTINRPHDHVWHKGLSLALPNVGPANFWGGPTYTREHEYQQLPNNGTTLHRQFGLLEARDGAVRVDERLDWLTESGQTWFGERRSMVVRVEPEAGAWVLLFATRFTNVSASEIVIGSPTTEGRPNAGYGGLFWRGPRSFTGGSVYAPGITGGDDLMGMKAPWMAFTGAHDEHGRLSTVVMVDGPGNLTHPTQWFVRSTPFACCGPAPFFSTEVPVGPGDTIALQYAVVVADGSGADGAAQRWAAVGERALEEMSW